MTYEQYEENHATRGRFILIFGSPHGRYLWNLCRNLGGSIAALCQYRRDAKQAIDQDIKSLEGQGER